MPNLTDEEIICEWMEPNAPKDGTGGASLKKFSPLGWWRYSMLSCLWKQPILQTCAEVEKLGHLREVEARLTHEQWLDYKCALLADIPQSTWHMASFRAAVHATAGEKIKALAAVLRFTPGSAPADFARAGEGRNV